MAYETIAILMFSTMLLMMLTGQRVFGAIGFVAVVAALSLWGTGGQQMGISAVMKLMKWNAMLTLPMFVFMGYVMSETRLAEDLYRMFHVWMGPGLRLTLPGPCVPPTPWPQAARYRGTTHSDLGTPWWLRRDNGNGGPMGV